MDERDRLNVPGSDPIADEVRPHTTDDDIRRGSWRSIGTDGEAGYFWPVALVVCLLIAATLLIPNWNDTPNKQVGQNTERPATTTTPKAPITPQPQ